MRFSHNIYFTLALIATLLGVAIFFVFNDLILSIIIVLILFLLGLSFFKFIENIYVYIIFLSFCLFGLIYSDQYHHTLESNIDIIDKYEGLYIEQKGEIHSLHKRKDYYDEYQLQVGHIGQDAADGTIYTLVRIPKNFRLNPGDTIVFSGKIYPIEDFNGFSYKKYMLSKSIYYSTSANSFDLIYKNKEGFVYTLHHYRQRFLSIIESLYPPREAIFLGGILLGARENIPKELREDFNNSGLTHFIAVSGFNITICVIFVTLIFGWMPPILRAIFVIGSIILFTVFVGLGAPVVRAAIMGIVAYLFLEQGHKVRPLTLLSFTAVCMVLYSPLILLYDVSFQLSFLAVTGIIYTQDFFKRTFFFLPQFLAIREAFVLTLSAFAFSLPILMFQFGQISLLSPIANMAVAWTIPIAMLLGAMSIIGEILSPMLGTILAFSAWVFLSYDMMMVQFFGNLEQSLLRFKFGEEKYYLQAIYFILLVYVIVLSYFKRKKQL